MDEITDKFEHIKNHYHCKICPGQFGWYPENEIESVKNHYKKIHQSK